MEARACLVLVRNQPVVRLTTRERILGTNARSDAIVPPAPHVYETPLATVQRILTHSAELTELKVRRSYTTSIHSPTYTHKPSRLSASGYRKCYL